eukprot:TRINITY_DN5662_c0_g1_i8.p1 TRINITY_DN5662_c0_g1~~TRINITY_DN5662_c0_g1_i8.p1  ORF type:complete len:102 (-),score=9.45 TRINITY_DN5662_c0_g1_i8:296-601(-)
MQLFELINGLLGSDGITANKHLSIQLFSVTPLSSDSGLITWLPHSDTVHELLKLYRSTHNISLDIEQTHLHRTVPPTEFPFLLLDELLLPPLMTQFRFRYN